MNTPTQNTHNPDYAAERGLITNLASDPENTFGIVTRFGITSEYISDPKLQKVFDAALDMMDEPRTITRESLALAADVDIDIIGEIAKLPTHYCDQVSVQHQKRNPDQTDGLPITGALEATGDPIMTAQAGLPYAMTDLGNAERLVALHGDKIRWDVSRKAWLTWDDTRWASDSSLSINALAAETARNIRSEAIETPSTGDGRKVGLELFKHAVRSESREKMAAMVEVAKSVPQIAVGASVLNANKWVLNVLNGTIDLRTGTLQAHSRDDLLTKRSPIPYRPDATCARWEQFLRDATGDDQEMIDFLQTVAGYTLTGDVSEEKLFLIYGPQASGKSTFLEGLQAICGDYSRTISSDLLTKRRDTNAEGASPELAGLDGVRMAAASEMEQGREIAAALVKTLTGGERITARHLYAKPFDFLPQFKLWVAVNHCPKVSAEDGGMWRRILRLGFEHTVAPEKLDKTLKPYLRDPEGGAPAVLAWAVKGCLKWQKDRGLSIPSAVEKSTAAYRQESDPLVTFIEDCLVFNSNAWTPWCDLWNTYNTYAADSGTAERYRVSPKHLQERLRSHDCVAKRRKHGGRGWYGVELAGDLYAE